MEWVVLTEVSARKSAEVEGTVVDDLGRNERGNSMTVGYRSSSLGERFQSWIADRTAAIAVVLES